MSIDVDRYEGIVYMCSDKTLSHGLMSYRWFAILPNIERLDRWSKLTGCPIVVIIFKIKNPKNSKEK